jgi:hypothetical protein
LNTRLKKLIGDKITQEVGKGIYLPVENTLWILNLDELNWYFQYENNTILYYNNLKFEPLLRYFSLEKREVNSILKEWFYESFGLSVSSISKKNSNYSYFVDDLINKKRKTSGWKINQRFGFPYQVVKRYSKLIQENKYVFVEDIMTC